MTNKKYVEFDKFNVKSFSHQPHDCLFEITCYASGKAVEDKIVGLVRFYADGAKIPSNGEDEKYGLILSFGIASLEPILKLLFSTPRMSLQLEPSGLGSVCTLGRRPMGFTSATADGA